MNWDLLKTLSLTAGRFIFRNQVTEYLASNWISQRLIKKFVIELERLQGIGSGAGVYTSGEQIATDLLSESEGNKVVFDIGANTGDFTEMIDKRIDDVSIHLFEPQNKIATELSNKYSKQNSKYVNGYALSSERTSSNLYYDEQGSGLASLSKRDLIHHGIDFDQIETIETRTLDWYCTENEIEVINWLKVDVEGHELEVLKGAESTISSKQIDFISFEFGGANIDTRTFFKDYYNFFDEEDYRIYRILPSGKFMKSNHIKNPKRSSELLIMLR